VKEYSRNPFTLKDCERLFTTANEVRESLSMLVLRILGNPFNPNSFKTKGDTP